MGRCESSKTCLPVVVYFWAQGCGSSGRRDPLRHAQAALTSSDHTIRIAPCSLEIAPGKVIKTTAYNGTAPGPALRLREGKPVAINVINDSGYPNLIHRYGLMITAARDGAVEEGSPIIQPSGSLLYTFTPKPPVHAGTEATPWR